jgi:hypothetical protein
VHFGEGGGERHGRLYGSAVGRCPPAGKGDGGGGEGRAVRYINTTVDVSRMIGETTKTRYNLESIM